MEYKVAVCDDEETQRQYLTSLVRCWAKERGHLIKLREFSSAESFLFAYEEEPDFDVLLLDIEMGAMDGVTMAKQVRRENGSVQIVFVTGYSDYISEGYEVEALHYLMKPVKEEKLSEVLDRAWDKLEKQEQYLEFETADGMVRIAISQIRYVDVQGNYVTIHSGSPDEGETIRMTLSEVEMRLDDRFYRAGRSLLVNLFSIRKVTRTEIHLTDGTVLPLPRRAYEGIHRAMIEKL